MGGTKDMVKEVSRDFLVKQCEYDKDALEALGKVQEIEKAGGWIRIRYSRRTGWIVTDERKGHP